MPPILFVVGTSADSGQTANTAGLVTALSGLGIRTAVCRLTGKSSSKDLQELLSSSASSVRDLSDYGFPSTDDCRPVELAQLFYTQLADVSEREPDLIVIQLTGSILNPQTRLVLGEAACVHSVAGVVLMASCSLSALCGVEILERLGHSVAAIWGQGGEPGRMEREINSLRSNLNVFDSSNPTEEITEAVVRHMHLQWLPLGSRVQMGDAMVGSGDCRTSNQVSGAA